ncbi:MAG: endonuclease [Patescibacteria group bacterium]
MNKVEKLYFDLLKKHGQPGGQWRLWCSRKKTRTDREEIIIGAILTQNTNWRNVEKAILNLKRHRACSLDKILKLEENIRQRRTSLREMIRPAGFFNAKARYLVEVSRFFVEQGGIRKVMNDHNPHLREQLLLLKGVGPETADSILNYALDKPIFVIDKYTQRITVAEKITRKSSYAHLQKFFMDRIKNDWRFYQNFHALIVIENKFKNNAKS